MLDEESDQFTQSIIAVESIFYIYESLYSLKKDMMNSCEKGQQTFIIQFFNNTDETISLLWEFIYEDNSIKFIKMDNINQ